MESYRREVEKMKQLQEGKEEEQNEAEVKEETLDRSRKTIAHHHTSPLSLPVLSLSSILSRRPAQRRGTAEAHPAAARERDGFKGTSSDCKKERKKERGGVDDDDLSLSRPLLSPSFFSQPRRASLQQPS